MTKGTDVSGPSFYWYDFETFGLGRRTDRPAQFAGIRTDMDLNPISEGDIIYARPSEDYLPSPESCLITGLTPQLCAEKGIAESEFAGEIWARFNTPETVSIGYNTLGFDDEVSRFLFWRNFLEPYAHQWKGGCSRWDIFPLVCAVWSLRGNDFAWPRWSEMDPEAFPQAENREGVCFKLEALSKANGIVHEHAHDAFSDVEATIGLARLIAEKEPRLWQWAFDNRSKAKVKAAVEKGPVVWVSPKFGQKSGFLRIAASIAPNTANPNEVFMWDLMHDPEELSALGAAEMRERLFARRDALPEGVSPLPVYRLSLNNAPFVCGSLKVLPENRAAAYGIDMTAVLQNFQKLDRVRAQLQAALSDYTEDRIHKPASDVDFGLYDAGFPSKHDTFLMQDIRRMSPEKLTSSANEGKLIFDDARFNELLFRFRARNWPDTLTEEEQARWRAFCHERLIESDGSQNGVLNISEYFDEIDRLQETAWDDEEKQAVLEALYEWGEQVGEACSA